MSTVPSFAERVKLQFEKNKPASIVAIIVSVILAALTVLVVLDETGALDLQLIAESSNRTVLWIGIVVANFGFLAWNVALLKPPSNDITKAPSQ